jgi:NADH-quinone oxidoreductase subunit E
MEENMDLKPVDKIVDQHQGKKTAVISILHDIQDRYNHLPKEALEQVAGRLGMVLTDIYGVATFYKSFSLIPKGKHSVTLCLGTACHVRGGPKILKEMTQQLGIEPGQTTKDKKFSLQVVNCLGVCAIGPVMFVDGKFYGEMTPVKARRIIDKLSKGKGGVKS